MKLKQTELYTTKEVSQILGISIRTVYERIQRKLIKPIKLIGTKNYYSKSQFEKNVETVVVYYPLKTTETFYIYESAMNNNQ